MVRPVNDNFLHPPPISEFQNQYPDIAQWLYYLYKRVGERQSMPQDQQDALIYDIVTQPRKAPQPMAMTEEMIADNINVGGINSGISDLYNKIDGFNPDIFNGKISDIEKRINELFELIWEQNSTQVKINNPSSSFNADELPSLIDNYNLQNYKLDYIEKRLSELFELISLFPTAPSDSNVVHRTFNEIINGIKTFNNNLNLTGISATTTNGDFYNNSTLNTFGGRLGGLSENLIGCIFSQTGTATGANTTNEISCFGSGVGTLTIPANFLKAGKNISIIIHGIIANTLTPTLRLKAKIGSAIVIDSTALTSIAITGTSSMLIRCDMTCLTTGASGTAVGQGYLQYRNVMAGETLSSASATSVTIDTTVNNTLDVTLQWGTASASNTWTTFMGTVSILN